MKNEYRIRAWLADVESTIGMWQAMLNDPQVGLSDRTREYIGSRIIRYQIIRETLVKVLGG